MRELRGTTFSLARKRTRASGPMRLALVALSGAGSSIYVQEQDAVA